MDGTAPSALQELVTLSGDTRQARLQRALKAIRTHLGMDVAFVSEFTGDRRTFRYVDCDKVLEGISPGVSAPLEQTYCKRVVDGALPEISGSADVSAVPPDPVLTGAMPIGSYASVPIRLSDGSVYGTFCAIGTAEDESLNPRDLKMMRAFADMAAEQIEEEVKANRQRRELKRRIQSVLDKDELTVVYQPIVNVMKNAVIGYESLSRFSTEPRRSPDVWFAEATEAGLDTTLEMRAITKALAALPSLPGKAYISVNASPSQIASGEFARLVQGRACHRVVLEITEHAVITDYDEVRRACEMLRNRGIRVAIDDAGSGYASFRHILTLEPDFIKLDMSLTRGIDSDSRRQALAAAFVAFASKTSSEIIAEGIETQAELEALKQLGVTKAQGYLLGRPGPL